MLPRIKNQFFNTLLLGSLVFLIGFVSPANSQSQAPVGFTLQQILSSPFPTNLVSAGKSGRIAWVFRTKGTNNVWVADAPNFAARQVTQVEFLRLLMPIDGLAKHRAARRLPFCQ